MDTVRNFVSVAASYYKVFISTNNQVTKHRFEHEKKSITKKDWQSLQPNLFPYYLTFFLFNVSNRFPQ